MAECSCIEQVDKHIAEYGAECLVNLIGPPRATIATYAAKKIRGKKAPYVIASYCPFCGVKYEREPAPAAAEKGETE